ncbi:MAG TPA: hypothetical protein VF138_06020 [Caulobacteraceae bacterium]
MAELDDPLEPEDVSEPIVEWRRERGPLIGRWDGPVVAAATVGALAALGLTAAAFLAGRRQGRKSVTH